MWLSSMPLNSAVYIGLYVYSLQWGCGKLVTPSGGTKLCKYIFPAKSKRMEKIKNQKSFPSKRKRLLPSEIFLSGSFLHMLTKYMYR